ncbi:DinB family protein [Streptomyces sp. SL13]|uniref:DinB family protein n=1 Tax=Streptantibioticus silvisoli TaxID=2705255 RepID=A0AA90KIM3_9ACTN|nr:DinB family protein [Streptantibioticus silvisoli]MDI5967716.1 DinB family protein [Streptantibioticus silvisoli]MDI5972749.1 DinB family protein [Streptantibioticus silvisoli]
MDDNDLKDHLRRYLQAARDVLLLKLDGVSEYDARRPLTPTGTNLLGLVKHMAGVELSYFGPTFGRPVDVWRPWFDEGAEPNADLWVTPQESREDIVGLYRHAWAVADATIDELPLEETGTVAWWPPEHAEAPLHRIVVHVIAETQRHAGHADIVRELIDGVAGLTTPGDNLPEQSPEWWADHHARVEGAARAAYQG